MKNIATIVIVVFPIAAGLFLTSLGVLELHNATVVPIPKWTVPYGFLLFSSAKSELNELFVEFGKISVDDNFARMNIRLHFSAMNISSPDEEVVGVQVPYSSIEVFDAAVSGIDSEGRTVQLDVTDRQVMAVGNNTSLAYLKFVASTGATHFNAVTVVYGLVWKGFIVREGFSSYSIMFPIGIVEPSVHRAVREHFPNIQTYYGESLGNISVNLILPEGIEVKRIYPLPTTELVLAGGEPRLYWEFTSIVGLKTPSPLSETITVSFEVRKKTELHNRLLFDSGLYMGLGIGLLISGLHEALKHMMEIRKTTAIP